ncbi:MAG TPA: hypothetical protein VMZ50_06405, partial [Phycisphaerae bacterium]|nr:hypothetical protein [Phycisphaerae bacterium]
MSSGRDPSGKTFVGFGFGPIQSGLFLYEAFTSGHFTRFVVAEIDEELVRAVRGGGGRYRVNIARRDRIDCVEVSGIEIHNPRDPSGRNAILDAVRDSDEMATCLPSIDLYDAGAETSAARMIADGLARRSAPLPTILYAAENHNRAAEILRDAVGRHARPDRLESVQTLNTVIGKMSGVISDPDTIERMRLETIAPGVPRAVLVEEFNRILISRVSLPGYRRGIDVF